MDEKLKEQAFEWAKEVILTWSRSINDPGSPLEGKQLDWYRHYVNDWGWPIQTEMASASIEEEFERYDGSVRNLFDAVYTNLAMNKYGKLLWSKEHPPKGKRKITSKWEYVHGAVNKNKGKDRRR